MSEVLAGVPSRQMPGTVYRLFSRLAWGVLAYNILVVLWGAYVRATGSGDGCGNNWPLCQGTVMPRAPQAQTLIEFTHRASVLLAFVAVVGLALWAYRLFPKGHRARLYSALALLFFFVEALLGAGLVLLRYVAHNASAGRAVYLSAHLVNTQILLALLAMTAWFGSDPRPRRWVRPSKLFATAVPLALAIAVSGAIAALGDTLFPPASLASGMRQDFAGTSSALLRLRTMHPVMAAVGGMFLLFAALTALRSGPQKAARGAMIVALLVAVQIAAGALNIALLAPIWLQILHLLLADLLWIALVVLELEIGWVDA